MKRISMAGDTPSRGNCMVATEETHGAGDKTSCVVAILADSDPALLKVIVRW
jgi:hypothetical protein